MAVLEDLPKPAKNTYNQRKNGCTATGVVSGCWLEMHEHSGQRDICEDQA